MAIVEVLGLVLENAWVFALGEGGVDPGSPGDPEGPDEVWVGEGWEVDSAFERWSMMRFMERMRLSCITARQEERSASQVVRAYCIWKSVDVHNGGRNRGSVVR